MDFDEASSGQHQKPSNQAHHSSTQSHHAPSSTQLFSSAKVVADAAQSALHNESHKLDKSKVAGAAADLLGAASHYGKLEEKSFGKYVEKAEDYLHNYGHSSHSSSSATTTTATATTTTHSQAHHSSGGADEGHGAASEGGYGEYFKMAQGFLK